MNSFLSDGRITSVVGVTSASKGNQAMNTQLIAVDRGTNGVEFFDVSLDKGTECPEFKALVAHAVSTLPLSVASELLAEIVSQLGFDPIVTKAMLKEAHKTPMREFDFSITNKDTGKEEIYRIRRDFSQTADDYVRLIRFLSECHPDVRRQALTQLYEEVGDANFPTILHRLLLSKKVFEAQETKH